MIGCLLGSGEVWVRAGQQWVVVGVQVWLGWLHVMDYDRIGCPCHVWSMNMLEAMVTVRRLKYGKSGRVGDSNNLLDGPVYERRAWVWPRAVQA